MDSSVLARVLLSVALVLAVLQVAQCQCEDYKSTKTTTCSMLFQSFQSALIGSETNLYSLKKTVAPASHPAPILVNVSYEISFGLVSDDLCPSVDNNSTLFNISETQYLNYGWTSSVLYTYYHPAELNRLQPQLVFRFLKALEVDPEDNNNPVDTAFTWDGTGPITTAELSLHVPSFPCSPSYEEVYNTLQDITSLINVYTKIQTNLTTWETKDVGYVLNGSSLSTDPRNWDLEENALAYLYLFCYVVSLIFPFVSTIVILYMLHTLAPEDTNSDNFKTWHSFLWTIVGVLAQFIVILLTIDIIQVGMLCSPSSCSLAIIFKAIWLSFTFVPLMFFFACSCIMSEFSISFLDEKGGKLHLFFPPFITIPIMIWFIPDKANTSTQDKTNTSTQDKTNTSIQDKTNTSTQDKTNTSIQDKTNTSIQGKTNTSIQDEANTSCTWFFHMIFYSTIFTFLSIVVFYTLPVLVLVVVYPIKVISAYSFLIAALVLYILIASYGEYKRRSLSNVLKQETEKQITKKQRIKYVCSSFFYSSLPMLNMLLIGIIMFFFVTVYNVISGSYSESTLFRTVISFLPSLILSSLTWFVKNRFLKWMDKPKENGIDTASQKSRQKKKSEDPTSNADTQQKHNEQTPLLNPQKQHSKTNEPNHCV